MEQPIHVCREELENVIPRSLSRCSGVLGTGATSGRELPVMVKETVRRSTGRP